MNRLNHSNYEFQVDHPEKYGFNPKQLLNHLTDIYLHLRGDVLARAIATDERSYRRELFETCTELLRNKNIKSEVYNIMSKQNCIIILDEVNFLKNQLLSLPLSES